MRFAQSKQSWQRKQEEKSMYRAFINNKEAGGIYKKCFSERAGAAVLEGGEEQLDKNTRTVFGWWARCIEAAGLKKGEILSVT